MDYTNSANNAIGYAQGIGSQHGIGQFNQARQESELEHITSRIKHMTEMLWATANQLREHADRVHGAVPVGADDKVLGNLRSGMIGEIHEALDQLERAHGFLAEHAERNCRLA